MKSLFSRGLLLVGLSAMLIGISGCGQETVAVVNGQKIMKQDYINRLERMPPPVQGAKMDAGGYVLQQLINEELLIRLADKEKVTPTEAQVEERYKQMANAPNFKENMQRAGWSKDQMLKMLKVSEAEFNLRTKDVKITDEEVKKYYDDNKDTIFTTPEYVMISVIVLNKKSIADSAINMLKKGVEFGTVAKKYSIDKTSAANGGQVPSPIYNMEQGGVPETLRKLLFSTKLGEYTEPIPDGKGNYQIFKVTKHTKKAVRKYEDESPRIRRSLMLKKGEKNVEPLKGKLAEFRDESNVKINIERYKQLEIKKK